MGDCVPVRPWHDSPIECLAEVRMIWRDKTEQTFLLSLRLYFLPENTSKGRVNHGEVNTFTNHLVETSVISEAKAASALSMCFDRFHIDSAEKNCK